MESWKIHRFMVCKVIVIWQHDPDWLRCDLCAAVCWIEKARPNRVPNTIQLLVLPTGLWVGATHGVYTRAWLLHCVYTTVNLRDGKGEMRRTVIICFVCPNVPLIGLGWMMFERNCLWRKSRSHLFFAYLDTVHCQDHFVFLLHVYCIAWKKTMLHSKAVTVWKCPFECCPSWSKHDLSLVLHKNGSGSRAAHSDFRLYAADGALCSWAKPTWWGHRGNR